METKVKKEKKVRQYRSRQGRSDKQYESNMKVLSLAFIGLLSIIILYGIVNVLDNVLG